MNTEPPDRPQKTLLIVNTGYSKKKFVFKRLKELGLYVVCLNREQSVWAKPYVDEWIIADTNDHSASLHAVSAYREAHTQKPIDGVITFWEDDVLLTTKLVDQLRVIGVSYSSAKKARNKYLFRQFCTSQGLPAPRFSKINQRSDLTQVISQLQFPIVLKPVYGSLTALVVKVDSPDELEKTYDFITKNISEKVETALHDGLSIFAEEYIDGDEVDIDIILQNGKVKLAIVSDNFDKSRGKFFLDKGQTTPSNLPHDIQENMIEMASVVLEKLQILNGCIHFEAKQSSHGAVPLEANLRMGGDYVYHYLRAAWGVDLVALATQVALGEYIEPYKDLKPKKYVIGWDLSTQESGIVNELSMEPSLKKQPYFEGFSFYKELGDSLLVPPEGYETLGWLMVSGENPNDADDNLESALKQVDFGVAKFDTLSFAGKTARPDKFSAARLNKELILTREKITYLSIADVKRLDLALVTNLSPYQHPQFFTRYQAVTEFLQAGGYQVTPIQVDDSLALIRRLQGASFDLVINYTLQEYINTLGRNNFVAALEMLDIPFTGSNSFQQRAAQDKILFKKVLAYHQIPTSAWDYAFDADDDIEEDLKYPLIIKPGNQENTINNGAYAVVSDENALRSALVDFIAKYRCPMLIEEYMDGDEVEVIITGNSENDYEIWPIHLLHYPNSITPFDRMKKQGMYLSECPPKKMQQKVVSLISEIALDTYSVSHCRDYAQVDIRLDQEGNPFVLEINTNPLIQYSYSKIDAEGQKRQLELFEDMLLAAINRYRKQSVELI